MKHHYWAALLFVFGLFPAGCTKNPVILGGEPDITNREKIHAFSDNKCQALADSLFNSKKMIASADDTNALMLEFTWATSRGDGKAQKINCYLKSEH